MEKVNYISIGILIGALFMVLILVIGDAIDPRVDNSDIPVKLEQPEFFLSDTVNIELLKDACEYYELEHIDIVITQAILETGYFRSKICKKYNNLFGLYNSSKRDYYKFNHWSESVQAYKDLIQYRYSEGDYYHWLNSIGYATDTHYINKLKILNKKWQKNLNQQN